MIDLHTHTTASDGTLSPAALVALAKEKNLAAIAVTDHDTIDGLAEALAAGLTAGIEVVPGIEISAEYTGGTLHILGYYIDSTDAQFLSTLAVLQKARADRNPTIIRKLQELGLRIELEDVIAEAGNGQVGRPHFAQAMLKKGHVKTAREAFDRYLAKGAAAYCDKFRFPPAEAIGHIKRAGGIPVLGHPSSLNCRSTAEIEAVVEKMVLWGIMGIEVYYPDHNGEQTGLYTELAHRHDLLITGGSDFHGQAIKGVSLGSGKGNLNIPYACLAAMKNRCGKQ